MSESDAGDPQSSDTPVQLPVRGSVCCVRCHRTVVASSGLTDHIERVHKRHQVTMEPGELDAIIELIRGRLVTERITSGASGSATPPRSGRERHLWNFFVRHDKRLKKLWSFLNSAAIDIESDGESPPPFS